MENENENFDQLKKLLALKKHEQPPPGYFNKLPGTVVSRIRAGRAADTNTIAKLGVEAPWLMRFWATLESKPIFAGAFGAVACALVLAGIFFAEQPPTRTRIPNPLGEQTTQASVKQPGVSSSENIAAASAAQGMMLADTNSSTAPTLFDLIKPVESMPASFSPGRTN